MPIEEFLNLNKYGNIRTRRFYQEKSNLSINPKGLGKFIAFKLFKYDYKHHMPPSLANIENKRYIMPTWEEVLPETTLNDINWVKPKPSVKKIENPNEWKFESKSDPGSYYVVTQVSDFKVKCTCTGQYRAKDRKCRHMKEVMAELGIK